MLKRLFDLVNARGEVVIVDQESGQLYVIQPLEDDFSDEMIDFEDFAEEWTELPQIDQPLEQNTADAFEWEVPVTNEKAESFSSEFEATAPVEFAPEPEMPNLSQNIDPLRDLMPSVTPAPVPLTDQGLIAKIDRDIEDWKNKQNTAVNVESEGAVNRGASLDEITLTPVPGQQSQAEPGSEEQFYIEPVE